MATTYRREVGLSFSLVVMMMFVSIVSCDITKDKQECANQLVGLATCLPYVGNEAKAPTLDCCTGLKEVLTKSKKCLCVLVKDRNDPSLGLKINATLALGLPDKCHAPNGDVSECPALLHLSPNSPDAKVFSDFGKDNATPSSSTTAPATKTSEGAASATSGKDKTKNGGGGSKRWSIIQMFYVILASSCVLLHFI